jgi:hypothetical protein
MAAPITRYAERLRAPVGWWVLGSLLVASLWLALIAAAPGRVTWVISAIAATLLVAVLTSYGAATIRVDDAHLWAGRAHIAHAHLGHVNALDAAQTRAATGLDADARAYLLLRPYLHHSVRVEITDPADPAPYWLISTRRPTRFAEALGEAINASRRARRVAGYDEPNS